MQRPGLGRPDEIRRELEGSLERLNTDRIDLYYLHRVDPTTPIEVTVEAMAALVEEGLIKSIGLSEISPSTLKRAHAVHPIAAVEQEYSLFTRDIEEFLLPVMRELGVALVAYSPFGRGMLTGALRSVSDLSPDDERRSRYPRFGEHLEKNLTAASALFYEAENSGYTPAELALGWLLAQGIDVIPIPGIRRRENFDANLQTVRKSFSPHLITRLSELFPPGIAEGDRYSASMMAKLDE